MPAKLDFFTHTELETLEDAVKGADIFVGLSKGNVVTSEILLSMNENSIVFDLENPDPEIAYNLAIKTLKDVIMATGRSEYSNQVNNVLGFSYIFPWRPLWMSQDTEINEEMKLAVLYMLLPIFTKNHYQKL